MSRLQESYELCVAALAMNREKCLDMLDAFNQEVEDSIVLRGRDVPYNFAENSLKCSDCFTSSAPTGEEKGNYYAIDLGGTNLRVVCVSLKGEGKVEAVSKSLNFREKNVTEQTPKGIIDRNTPATVMFDAIAELTRETILEAGEDPGDQRPIAFTFSFPMKQFSLSSGVLMEWTKEFETGKNTADPVEGQDAAQLLDAAFRRSKMRCYVACITNDTVGTMLSGGYENNSNLPTARVGCILGTGFNIAVMDPFARSHNYTGSILNLECGNFSKVEALKTLVDIELDHESSSPGLQLTEKMISGHYLPEQCRLWIIRVFQHLCPKAVWRNDSITAYDCSLILSDDTEDLTTTDRIMRETYDWELDLTKLKCVHGIVKAVWDRSACIAAVLCSCCAIRTRHLQEALGGVTIAIDGSLYQKNPKYREALQRNVDMILGPKAKLVHFVMANDGSGKGAAVLAACS